MASQISANTPSPRRSPRTHKDKKQAGVIHNLRIDPRLRAPRNENASPTSTQPRPGRFETVIDKLAIVAYPVDPASPTSMVHCRPSSPTPSLASDLSTVSGASDFSVSEHDEIIQPSCTSPAPENAISLSFHISSPAGSVYEHTILASSFKAEGGLKGLSPTFVGILRTMHADRPYFDPSGPPVWTAEYTPLYEVCGKFYSQRLSVITPSSPHRKSRSRVESMLYVKQVTWLSELASMCLHPSRSPSPIGSVLSSPGKRGPEWHTVPVFEESDRYGATGFEPLEGPRPLYKTPDEIEKCDECWKAALYGNTIEWEV